MATETTPRRWVRVLAEAITVGTREYPLGTVTDQIPPAVLRWLVKGTEYEDAPAPPPPAKKEAR